MGGSPEHRTYVLVSYRRETHEDVRLFEEQLRPLAGAQDADIVVDLTGFVALSSPEIGVLVRIANLLAGSGHVLRIVTSLELRDTFVSTNLHKLETIALYPDRESVLQFLEGRSAAQG